MATVLLREGEVPTFNAEGKRGVWRTIGSRPVFIQLRQGESIPQAVKRELTTQEARKTAPQIGPLPSQSPPGGSPEFTPSQPLAGGWEMADGPVLRASPRDTEATYRHLLAHAFLAEKTTRFARTRLWPSWEGQSVPPDPTTEPAWQKIGDGVRELAEILTSKQREGSVLVDNRTGTPVGPLVLGSDGAVANDPQVLVTRVDGDYTHIHSHQYPVGPSASDVTFFLQMPHIRRMLIVTPTGTVHVLEKPAGFTFRMDQHNDGVLSAYKQLLRTHVQQLGQGAFNEATQATTMALASHYGVQYRKYAIPIAKTFRQRYVVDPEDIVVGPEGKRGVWRTISGHAVFIPLGEGTVVSATRAEKKPSEPEAWDLAETDVQSVMNRARSMPAANLPTDPTKGFPLVDRATGRRFRVTFADNDPEQPELYEMPEGAETPTKKLVRKGQGKKKRTLADPFTSTTGIGGQEVQARQAHRAWEAIENSPVLLAYKKAAEGDESYLRQFDLPTHVGGRPVDYGMVHRNLLDRVRRRFFSQTALEAQEHGRRLTAEQFRRPEMFPMRLLRTTGQGKKRPPGVSFRDPIQAQDGVDRIAQSELRGYLRDLTTVPESAEKAAKKKIVPRVEELTELESKTSARMQGDVGYINRMREGLMSAFFASVGDRDRGVLPSDMAELLRGSADAPTHVPLGAMQLGPDERKRLGAAVLTPYLTETLHPKLDPQSGRHYYVIPGLPEFQQVEPGEQQPLFEHAMPLPKGHLSPEVKLSARGAAVQTHLLADVYGIRTTPTGVQSTGKGQFASALRAIDEEANRQREAGKLTLSSEVHRHLVGDKPRSKGGQTVWLGGLRERLTKSDAEKNPKLWKDAQELLKAQQPDQPDLSGVTVNDVFDLARESQAHDKAILAAGRAFPYPGGEARERQANALFLQPNARYITKLWERDLRDKDGLTGEERVTRWKRGAVAVAEKRATEIANMLTVFSPWAAAKAEEAMPGVQKSIKEQKADIARDWMAVEREHWKSREEAQAKTARERLQQQRELNLGMAAQRRPPETAEQAMARWGAAAVLRKEAEQLRGELVADEARALRLRGTGPRDATEAEWLASWPARRQELEARIVTAEQEGRARIAERVAKGGTEMPTEWRPWSDIRQDVRRWDWRDLKAGRLPFPALRRESLEAQIRRGKWRTDRLLEKQRLAESGQGPPLTQEEDAFLNWWLDVGVAKGSTFSPEERAEYERRMRLGLPRQRGQHFRLWEQLRREERRTEAAQHAWAQRRAQWGERLETGADVADRIHQVSEGVAETLKELGNVSTALMAMFGRTKLQGVLPPGSPVLQLAEHRMVPTEFPEGGVPEEFMRGVALEDTETGQPVVKELPPPPRRKRGRPQKPKAEDEATRAALERLLSGQEGVTLKTTAGLVKGVGGLARALFKLQTGTRYAIGARSERDELRLAMQALSKTVSGWRNLPPSEKMRLAMELVQRQRTGTAAERFAREAGLRPEYQAYQPATPGTTLGEPREEED